MNIVMFLISFVLFIGGMGLMGYSFEESPYQLVMFLGGILAVSASVAFPVHILKRVDGA